jgi:predicted DNA-binding antitoxin AbrB/MazE fold protein
MLTTVQAVVEKGQIRLLEPIPLQTGQRLLVTFLTEDEMRFWLQASQSSLTDIWDNEEDDVYAELLEG